MLAQFVDGFLPQEVGRLSALHAELKEALAAKQGEVERLSNTAAELNAEIAQGIREKTRASNELGRFRDAIARASDDYDALQTGIVGLTQDRAKTEADLLQVRAKFSAESIDAEQRRRRRAQEIEAEFSDRHGALEAEFKAKVTALEAQLQTAKTALAAALQEHAAAAAELENLTAAITTAQSELNQQHAAAAAAESALKQQQTALKQQLEAAKVQHTQNLEKLAAEERRRIEAINEGIKIRAGRVQQLRDEYNELKTQLIEDANERIELLSGKFELYKQSSIQEIENERIDAKKQIENDKQHFLMKHAPAITGPLEEVIEAQQIEIGRLQKKLADKGGKSSVWEVEQIRNLLVKAIDDGTLRPNHLRIAGESESGKSHLVNQLVTQALGFFGVKCDFELFDPYPSDTRWAISPTIAEDSEAVLERLHHWKQFCEAEDSQKLPCPLVLICDEGDEMIRQYKGAMVDCIKAIWKRGRHVNVVLWLLGQNGNVQVLKPLDWSDCKNAGMIFLNQVCFDYLKNGMKGRNTAAIQGQLEAIAEKDPYYALIHPKGKPRPYAVSIPKALFPAEPVAALPPVATVPALPAAAALACPKCGSTEVKRNGKHIDGRQKIKCSACGKTSIVNNQS